MLVHLLPPRPVPGVMTGSENNTASFLWDSAGLDVLSISMYIKPLGEINHHDRMRYQYSLIHLHPRRELCCGCSFAVLRDSKA